MPTEQECEELKDKEYQLLKAGQEALDEYNAALDARTEADAERTGSAVKGVGHGLDGDRGDFVSDVVDFFTGARKVDSANNAASRAWAKVVANEAARRAAYHEWCSQCGGGSDEDGDDGGDDGGDPEIVDFPEDEGEVVIGFPGGLH